MKRSRLAVTALLLLVACTDEPGPTSGNPPRLIAEISDANHGSLRNPHFFWLAPILPNAPTFNGPFNPRLSPVVQICDQLTSPCPNGHEHARFTRTSGPGGATVGVDVGGQKYVVNWNTSSTSEPVGTSFRIAVLVHDVVLGFADVDIVATGKAQNANTRDDIALVDGRTLPIKFRVEEGAIAASCTTGSTQLDCAEGTASPTATTTITTGGDGAGNQAGTLIPAGALSQVVTVTIRRNLTRPCIPPPFDLPQYQGCYDFFTDPGPTTFITGVGIDPVIVGICIETELTRSAGEHAHIAQFDAGQPVRILPQASAGFLNCDATDPYHDTGEGTIGARQPRSGDILARARFGLRRLWRYLTPRPLVAAHIGVGGTPPGYSTFTWTLPVTIGKDAGDGDVAPVGTAISTNPLVVALDSGGAPAAGVIVHFHALQGTVADTVDTTDASGFASSGKWTLGSSPGQDSLVATSVGAVGSPLLFTATALRFTFTEVTVGGAHSCALNGPDSAAACWGVNGDAASPSGPAIAFGQLGNASSEMCGAFPCSTVPIVVTGGHKFIAIAGGARHTCATEGGTADVYCWGRGNSGQLGNGATDSTATPVAVSGPFRSEALSAGGLFNGHTCGIDVGSGLAYCWGDNGFGQLGDGTHTTRLTPVPVFGGRIFTSISAGQAHTCAVENTGDLYCWGRNFFGQLGNSANTDSPTPVLVSGGLTWDVVSAGFEQTCAITHSVSGTGQAYCWGRNDVAQLGLGHEGGAENAPAAVATSLSFIRIGTSGFFSCGIASSGAGYCWGRNDSGELGKGSFTGSSTCNLLPGGTVPCDSVPVAVAGGHTFAALDAHGVGDHVCGLAVESGSPRVYCWGRGGTGQLGNGATAASATPVLVSGQ